MSRNIFISFEFGDKGLRNDLAMMFQSNGGRIQGKPVWVQIDVTSEGEKAIKREIRKVLDDSIIALFLIGQNVHNSPWVSYELSYASSTLGIPCFGIQSPRGLFGVPQVNMGLDILPWKENDIGEILNQF